MTEITTIKCRGVNSYLLETKLAKILIDFGHRKDFKLIERQLERKNLSLSDIQLIILTHGHMDHVGFAEEAQKTHKCKIAMNYADGCIQKMYYNSIMGSLMYRLSKKELKHYPKFTPDIILSDGQSLDSYGLDAKIIFLPGHTDGSVGVLFDDGSLFCGDMYMNMIRPSLSYIYHNKEQLDCSHKTLEKLNVTTIYPGHGKPFLFKDLVCK